MGSALELLLSLGSASLGTIHHLPHTAPANKPCHSTDPAPRLHLCQPCGTQSLQGMFRAGQGRQGMERALPRARLPPEAAQGWELSPCRLCIVCNCHWLFLSLFSHFLKSLT